MPSAPTATRRRTARHRRLQVSPYDRVSGLLVSLLVLIGVGVFIYGVIYLTLSWTDRKTAVPVALAEASRPSSAAQGLKRDLEPPGVEEALELQEPTLPQTLTALTSAISARQAVLDDFSVESNEEAGQGQGLGDSRAAGPGGEGPVERVARGDRWKWTYEDVPTLQEYAAQLDAFGVELAIDQGNDYAYASGFDSGRPRTRVAAKSAESRLRFVWDPRSRLRQADRRLMVKAGLEPGNRRVIRYLPLETEQLLAGLELQYLRDQGRDDVNEIERTEFQLRESADGYAFIVTKQEYGFGY